MAISNRMNPVIHFEMPMRDEGRARKFYESALGWQTTALGPEAGGFACGGTVLGEPFELPGVGLFASFMDTEGNVVNINQDFTIKRL